MEKGAKLAFMGAAGAATLAAVGAAGMAYNYFADPELGPERRKTAIDLATSLLRKSGSGAIDKNALQTLIDKFASR